MLDYLPEELVIKIICSSNFCPELQELPNLGIDDYISKVKGIKNTFNISKENYFSFKLISKRYYNIFSKLNDELIICDFDFNKQSPIP